RAQSLPHLLHCADSAGEVPLGQYFAAETVCFLGFSGYVQQGDTPLGRSAMRVLHRTLEGLRAGVQPQVVAEARIGEMIESVWDTRSDRVDPLAIRVYVEALRMLRRAPHAELTFGTEIADQEAFSWQMSRLAALEPSLQEYLHEAPELLSDALTRVRGPAQRDILTDVLERRA